MQSWFSGQPFTEGAARAGVSTSTVRRWVRRFIEHGLGALAGEAPARPARPAAGTDPRGHSFTEASKTFLAGIGAELHLARSERGWTRQQLIERCGVEYSPERVANWEHGLRAVPVVALAITCRALEISMAEVVGRSYTSAFDRLPQVPK
ncbi:helix-turn-helix domain-containing protein [Amycolatopsis sp. NPDC050768]|uniref:helix-turn-helix domain-containing protein n=1 Tax=unclassified Amycolatopsis TaxID=2618356 RepID=UPI001C69C1FC|nr:helix-turn-helix domain-containing protein [Amycolatopsis sp. DSM 110486]